MKCYVGIDIGGTNIKFGKFINDELVKEFYWKTNPNKENPIEPILEMVSKGVDECVEGDELVGLGVGIPGPVDHDGTVLRAENIYWPEFNLLEKLKEMYPNIKVAVLNDANAATIGEWYFGSGEKTENMVFLTLGTGIGGGVIINGKLYKGFNGSAGEVGHIKLFPFNGRPCNCGEDGCLEQYASANGIIKTAYGMINNGDTILTRRKRITAKDVFDAAEQNDAIALEILDKTAYYLAIGLVNIANTINPNMIVLGGGLSKAKEALLERVQKHFDELAFVTIRGTEIRLATLYNIAGLYGAYYEVKNQ